MHTFNHADKAGTGTPEKDEAAGGSGFMGQERADSADSTEPELKLRATLAAEFALAGWTFTALQSGYLVSRWGRSRHCDIDGAIAFLAEIKGVRS